MTCKKCGKEIADTAKFCGYCGEKIESSTINVNNDYSWINETQPKRISDDDEFRPFSDLDESNDIETEELPELRNFDKEEFKPFQQINEDKTESEPLSNLSEFKPFNELNIEDKYDTIKEDNYNNALDKNIVSSSNPLNVENKQDEVSKDNYEIPLGQNITSPISELKVEQPSLNEETLGETARVDLTDIKDSLIMPAPEKNVVEQPKEEKTKKEKTHNNNGSKILIIIMTLIILGLAGYIVYDKIFATKAWFIGMETDNADNVDNANNIKEEQVNTLTEVEALSIANERYSSIYGETFNTMYYNLINNNDSVTLQTIFTSEAIEKLKLNATYVTGLFGTTDQVIRNLELVSYNDNYIVATGKNSTDTYKYYITFKNIDDKWYIDMFE